MLVHTFTIYKTAPKVKYFFFQNPNRVLLRIKYFSHFFWHHYGLTPILTPIFAIDLSDIAIHRNKIVMTYIWIYKSESTKNINNLLYHVFFLEFLVTRKHYHIIFSNSWTGGLHIEFSHLYHNLPFEYTITHKISQKNICQC